VENYEALMGSFWVWTGCSRWSIP